MMETTMNETTAEVQTATVVFAAKPEPILLRRTASFSSFPASTVNQNGGVAAVSKRRRRHSFHGLTAKELAEAAICFVDDETDSGINKHNNDYRQYARKAGVAFAGSTLTAVGLIMIPLPVPLGAVVAGAGMSVLGTEFPAMKKILDGSKGALMGVFRRTNIYKKNNSKRFVDNGDDTVVFERIPSGCSLESYSSDTSVENANKDVFATCFSDNMNKEDGVDEIGNAKVEESISDGGRSQWSKFRFARIGKMFASKNTVSNQ